MSSLYFTSSVRNKLFYVEDIASEYSIICVTESHLDTNIIDNDIIRILKFGIITSYQIISPEAKFKSYLGFTQISCDVYTRTPPPKQFLSFLNIFLKYW
jgi:hypothetical protein